jgi:hypothetical protein
MTFRNDPNRLPPDDPLLQRDVQGRSAPDNTMEWGAPLAMTAVVLFIAGLLFFNSAGDRTTMASNNTPAVTAPEAQSTPSPDIGKTSPPPAKTQ